MDSTTMRKRASADRALSLPNIPRVAPYAHTSVGDGKMRGCGGGKPALNLVESVASLLLGAGCLRAACAPEQHVVGQPHPQTIESNHSSLRTPIKWFVRRRSCCAKTTTIHDRVSGLCIHRSEFGPCL